MRLVGFFLVGLFPTVNSPAVLVDDGCVNAACAAYYQQLVDKREELRSEYDRFFQDWKRNEPHHYQILISYFEGLIQEYDADFERVIVLWDEYLRIWTPDISFTQSALYYQAWKQTTEIRDRILDDLVTRYPEIERVESGRIRFEHEAGVSIYSLEIELLHSNDGPQIVLTPVSTIKSGSDPLSYLVRFRQYRVGAGLSLYRDPAFFELGKASKKILRCEIDTGFMDRVERGQLALNETAALAAFEYYDDKLSKLEEAKEKHRKDYETWLKEQRPAKQFVARAFEQAALQVDFSPIHDLKGLIKSTSNSPLREALSLNYDSLVEDTLDALVEDLVNRHPEITSVENEGIRQILKLEYPEYNDANYWFLIQYDEHDVLGPGFVSKMTPLEDLSERHYDSLVVFYPPLLNPYGGKLSRFVDGDPDQDRYSRYHRLTLHYEEVVALEADPEFMRFVWRGQLILANRP